MNAIDFGLVRADGKCKMLAGELTVAAKGDGDDRTDSVRWDLGDHRGKGPAAGVVVTNRWAEQVTALRFTLSDGNTTDIPIAEDASERGQRRHVGVLPLVVGSGTAQVTVRPHFTTNRKGVKRVHVDAGIELPGEAKAGLDLDEDGWED